MANLCALLGAGSAHRPTFGIVAIGAVWIVRMSGFRRRVAGGAVGQAVVAKDVIGPTARVVAIGALAGIVPFRRRVARGAVG